MKNFNLANFIDFIFINLLFFLIGFVWIKYFSNNILLSSFISITALIIFNLIRYFFKNKKRINNNINKKLETDIEQYMFTFLSNNKEENLKFFYKTIKNESKKIDFEKNLVYYQKDKKFIALCPIFEDKELIGEKCLKFISFSKKLNISQLYFLCCDCNLKTSNFLNGFKDINIKVLTKKQIYTQLLRSSGIYPEIKFDFKENKRIKFKELINISFNKSRAKGYFFSGLFILFCSFIVRYNFYYVFMSSLLFLFTIFCHIKKDTSQNQNLQL